MSTDLLPYVWADFGPTLAESPKNPNENCFTLVVLASDYDRLRQELELSQHRHQSDVSKLHDKLAQAADELAALKLAAWDVYVVVTDTLDSPCDFDEDELMKKLNELGELLPAERP